MFSLQPFINYIKQQQLFNVDDKILLAVSGGKDSVLMVHLFKLAGINFGIAHCNFNLRGAEAHRDEAFVKLLAEEVNVPYHIVHFDTKAFAEQQKISIQMAARQLRYEWFEKVRVENNYQYIAVAHHQNDSIETLLLNLVRGTGISGMHGILPKRGYLVRPLLFLSRQQIDDEIAENNLSYVEDSSNISSKYARNKIRLEVVPHLRNINPNLEETFSQNIERFAEVEQLVKEIAQQKSAELLREVSGGLAIAIDEIKKLKPQKLLLFEILKDFNFTSKVVDEVLASLANQTGTSFYSATHRLTLNRDHILLTSTANDEGKSHFLNNEGSLDLLNNLKLIFYFSENAGFNAEKNSAFVDATLLVFPLVVRFWCEGDKFMPLGMRNFKTLSDFFVNAKVPLPQKHKIPLLINGNGDLIWVAGMRQDERYKVTATTKKVAIFELSNGQ